MNSSSAQSQTAPEAIILAAGKGTRMGGDLPKVLFEVAGRPMLHWVLDACEQAGVARSVVVIGYKGEMVRDAVGDRDGVSFVEQTEQLGTAHAADQARPLFEGRGAVDTLVLAGDGPLIRAATLEKLLTVHRETAAAATLATAVIDDPTGYGRVVRDSDGGFGRIVEQKDASPEQLAIHEVNPSYYCFGSAALFGTLSEVKNANKSGEYYLTDVPGILKGKGQTVSVVDAVPKEDVLSINTPEQLAEVDRLLRERLGQG